jgi:predicted RNase H-like HicB family nuclease
VETFNFVGVVVQEDQGYMSLCLELDVASQGATVEEAKAMLMDAVSLYLESAIEGNLPYLRPVPPEEDPRLLAPQRVVEVFSFKVAVNVRAYV